MVKVLESTTVWDLVEQRAEETPDATMIVDEFGRSLTFSEFRDAALGVASALARHIDSASTVAWQIPTSPEAFLIMAALARLECVQAPLLPILRKREVAFVVEQLKCDLLVHPGFWRGFNYTEMAQDVSNELGCATLSCEGDWSSSQGFRLPMSDPALLDWPRNPPTPDAIRWIYYTSGTSGQPKGVRHSDRTVMASRQNLTEGPQFGADDVTPITSPVTHIGGIMALSTQLDKGFKTVLSQQFDPIAFPKLASLHGVTVFRGAVPILRSCLAAQEAAGSERLFPHLRAVQAGGSARPRDLHHRFKAVLGVPVAITYGMTECPGVTYSLWNDDEEFIEHTDGRPVPGGAIKIVDADGKLLPVGERGEILVMGPQLFLGYVDDALNADAFDADGFFYTGDIGYVDEKGYLTVAGRIKDIIIRNGENISAMEVENVLLSLAGVADVAVIGVPSELTGERCCAVVELAPGSTGVTLAQIKEHCIESGIARQKIPEEVVIVTSLPRNAMGKIMKQSLRETYARDHQ
jgi:acyl-CoA synthetase (AMP-forming)/AMP-acid ligase II